ncbi:aspartate-semialdehyde dehydrogenase [Corallococcus exiguus]|uniref:aspartate-semialdehyde dehydrogenase n=1 Tax=Corallococcus TaxID=83461 RepID=UPI000EE5F85D|nr:MULTISPECIES: aspartate-semialdehyde dehydrogenase [Corallococcus]NNB90263.1 aspartate-semialdehyde dehydrogenase [Corallococcus exiguus]NNB95107.1 aspartate-semialdehyde dehydrogenase [Corallococcus exiguus]NNC03826.1 aspartate-semialdehyde dehydrogenase [Corallococcus exiguus]RKH77138.1 aspartate-semialdehyde dehydrogenase [Corallococcus sp. AB032C]
MAKLRAVLIGATGLAGQQFIAALKDHPFIELTGLAASPRSAGKSYADALRASNGMLAWFVPEPLPESIARMTVVSGDAVQAKDYDIAFSAVEADVAREIEPRLARDIPVFSAASAFRYDADVPLLLPPVNAAHAPLINEQRRLRGWKGFIVPIPNCTTTGLAVTLAPLAERFGVKAVLMTSLQAMSGAGRSPGVIGLDILDNVVPYIPKEEHKVEVETKKILGGLNPAGASLTPHDVRVSCTCTRVAVLEGHTESVFVSLGKKATVAEVAQAMREWQGAQVAKDLPSAPPRWIEVLDDPFRPQPRMDRDTHGGMATTVGRIREDGVLENGFKYVLVSHNTKMGAAKGAILVAELLRAQGLLG